MDEGASMLTGMIVGTLVLIATLVTLVAIGVRIVVRTEREREGT